MQKIRVRVYSNGLCIAQRVPISVRVETARGFGWNINDAIKDYKRLNGRV